MVGEGDLHVGVPGRVAQLAVRHAEVGRQGRAPVEYGGDRRTTGTWAAGWPAHATTPGVADACGVAAPGAWPPHAAISPAARAAAVRTVILTMFHRRGALPGTTYDDATGCGVEA